MELSELRLLLAAVRRLRGGAVDLADVDGAVQARLGRNLAGACRTLVRWADESLADRRAADAFVRFHGLGQMPERRAAIAATLRTLDDALELTRAAVRTGAKAAPELLGLLRDAVARLPPSLASADLVAGVLSQHTIVAREAGRIDGLQSGGDALSLGIEAISLLRPRTGSIDPVRSRDASRLLTFALRAAQELAELADTLGMLDTARRALRQMPPLLEHKEPEERRLWQQQYRQTAASVLRHTAQSSPRPARWLDAADRAAEASYQLAMTTDTPAGTVLAAANQRTSVALTRLRSTDASVTSARYRRRLALARRRADEALALTELVDGNDRPHRSAVLGAYRRRWELAQLAGDHDELADARAATLDRVGAWTPPTQLAKLDRLDQRSAKHP